MKMWQVIRDYIKEKGLIKNVVADKIDMDHQKLYRILSGNQNMTVDEYELICRGLGLEPSYFFRNKISLNEKTKTA